VDFFLTEADVDGLAEQTWVCWDAFLPSPSLAVPSNLNPGPTLHPPPFPPLPLPQWRRGRRAARHVFEYRHGGAAPRCAMMGHVGPPPRLSLT
jgi:hypothetical protein